MDNKIVKTCDLCKRNFTIDDLIYNPDLKIIGMTFIEKLEKAYYFFHHDIPDCETSFIIDAEVFKHLIKDYIPVVSQHKTELCEKRCTNIEDLSICNINCRQAPFRKFLQFVLSQKDLAKEATKTKTRV